MTTQAITNCLAKARGPEHPWVNLLTQQTFRLDHPRDSPRKETPGDASSDHQPLPHQPLRGQNHKRHWRDQSQPLPQLPSPSLHCGFESIGAPLLTALLMSSMSDRSEGSQHSQCGRQHREDRTHMKKYLPVFKRGGC